MKSRFKKGDVIKPISKLFGDMQRVIVDSYVCSDVELESNRDSGVRYMYQYQGSNNIIDSAWSNDPELEEWEIVN